MTYESKKLVIVTYWGIQIWQPNSWETEKWYSLMSVENHGVYEQMGLWMYQVNA